MHQFLFRWVSVAECLIQGYKLIGDSLSVDVVAELLRYLLFEKTSLGESLCGEKTYINGSRVWESWMLLESVEFWRIDSSVPAMCGQLLHRDLCPCWFADLEFPTLAVVQARHFARTWHSFCCEWILCDFDTDGISRMSWNSLPEKKKGLKVVPASPET